MVPEIWCVNDRQMNRQTDGHTNAWMDGKIDI